MKYFIAMHLRKLNMSFLLGFVISIALVTIERGDAENIVDTDPSILLQRGTEGLVPCRVKDTPEAVVWSKGETFDTSDAVVYFDLTTNTRGMGPGFDARSYNITDDFSLAIKNVNLQDEGRYFCEVVIPRTGFYNNQTDVSIFSLPDDAYPALDVCLNKTVEVTGGHNCSYYGSQTSLNITCSVNGYYPNNTVCFQHNSLRVEDVTYKEWENEDGTFGSAITMQAVVSFYPYECVTIIFGKNTQNVATVFIRRRPENSFESENYGAQIGISIMLFVTSLVIPAILTFFMVRSQRKAVEKILGKTNKLDIRNEKLYPTYLYILDKQEHQNLDTVIVNVLPQSKTLAHESTRTIFSAQSLRTLVMNNCSFNDVHCDWFFSAMQVHSSNSSIEAVYHSNDILSCTSSVFYAIALSQMPRLRFLSLRDVKLKEGFFYGMSYASHKAKVVKL